MFLPLANLVPFQLALLDAEQGPQLINLRRSQPRLTAGDPEAIAYSDIFAFNDGNAALLHVGRYLLERAANEVAWLENLPRSPIPVVYLWGLTDSVNPVRIPNYVWSTYLDERAAPSSFWILPSADHYPQRDRPEEVAKIVRLALTGKLPGREAEGEFMREYSSSRSPDDGVYVGHSRIEALQFPSSIEYTPSG